MFDFFDIFFWILFWFLWILYKVTKVTTKSYQGYGGGRLCSPGTSFATLGESHGKGQQQHMTTDGHRDSMKESA